MSDDMKTVLAIDDNDINRFIVEEQLKPYYKVFSSHSGEDGLEVLKKEKVDLILLDVVMPDISGIELCKMFKRSESLKDVPIIFLTGNNMPEGIKEGLEAGASDYMIKPFNIVELRARIETQFKLKEANQLKVYSEKLKTINSMIISLNHEIRNPLSVLAVGLNLIDQKKKEIPVELESVLESMKESTERIVSLLDKAGEINEVETESYCEDASMIKLVG